MTDSAEEPPTVLDRPPRTGTDPVDPGDLARGTTVGRYVVIDKIGQGGMGVVYSAYDHALHRRVALKLVTSRRDRVAQERLLAEARTMAQLSHPSIVTVYDVGEFRGQLFLAMEFVEGKTLRSWRAAEARTWREVIEIYAQAGEGLAFAHTAGVIHRDFKPDNVLVDATGRARVTDFGLAKVDPDAPNDLQPSTSNITKHTISGRLAGTPGYMSPEQLMGEPTDPRTDQYAFCVALFEALFGDLPAEIARPEQVAPTIPRDLIDAIRRGLADSPNERWPAMRELLSAIVPRPRSRRWPILVGAIGIAAVGAVITVMVAKRPAEVGCAVATPAVWDRTHRVAARRGFDATNIKGAHDAGIAFEDRIDSWLAQWRQMAESSCHATAIGQQSATLLDLRSSCLAHELDVLRSIIELAEHADAQLVDTVSREVLQLPSVENCADTKGLLEIDPLPASPISHVRIAAARKQLALVTALTTTSHYDTARPLAIRLVHDADELGYAPLVAEASAEYGTVEIGRAADPAAAADALWKAIAAQPGRTDWLGATIWLDLITVLDQMEHRPAAALQVARVAASIVRRTSAPAWAIPYLEARIGKLLYELDRPDEALQHLDAAIDGLTKAHSNYYLAYALTEQAAVFAALGNTDRRIELLEKALKATSSADTFERIKVMDYLIDAYTQAHRTNDAIAIGRKALSAIADRVDEPVLAVRLHLHLARALRLDGLDADALAELHTALEIADRELDPQHASTQGVLYTLGEIEIDRGNPQAAVKYFERAWGITMNLSSEAALSPAYIAPSKIGGLYGAALYRTGKLQQALLVFGRANSLVGLDGHLGPDDRAIFYSQFAPALWDGGSHEKARQAMTLARDAARELSGPAAEAAANAADDWLARHH